MSHTPGPWDINYDKKLGWFEISSNTGSTRGGYVVLASRSPIEHMAETSVANGLLMRAAPELLEALNDLLDCQNGPPLIDQAEEWRASVKKARAAIAKAEGAE